MSKENNTITRCILHGPKDLRLEQTTIDPPSPDEIQIEIKCTGLCGSDMHYYQHGRLGDFLVSEPLVLGHESAGIVMAIGTSVRDHEGGLRVGDKVALECGVPCESCKLCMSGRYNLCKDMRFRSSARRIPYFQGTLQTRVNHPARWCHRLPESMSLREGALLEPLSVAVHAVSRGRVGENDRVVVLGAGPVGIMVAAVAESRGASVHITDIDEQRVRFATERGGKFGRSFATGGAALPPGKEDGGEGSAACRATEERAKTINSWLALSINKESEGADIVFDCTGVPDVVHLAIHTAAPGARVVLVGMGSPFQNLHIGAAALKEVDLVGSFRYAAAYPQAIKLVESKTFDFERLITHSFDGLWEAEDAFKCVSAPRHLQDRMVMKVVIES